MTKTKMEWGGFTMEAFQKLSIEANNLVVLKHEQ